jgi:hypothetical protein
MILQAVKANNPRFRYVVVNGASMVMDPLLSFGFYFEVFLLNIFGFTGTN